MSLRDTIPGERKLRANRGLDDHIFQGHLRIAIDCRKEGFRDLMRINAHCAISRLRFVRSRQGGKHPAGGRCQMSGYTKAPRPPIRFPGITRAAKRLKVTRIHLYLVLSGQRTSHRLLKRYTTLTAKDAA